MARGFELIDFESEGRITESRHVVTSYYCVGSKMLPASRLGGRVHWRLYPNEAMRVSYLETSFARRTHAESYQMPMGHVR